MPEEKAPSSGAFLSASLMYFCCGKPMHFYSGVDKPLREPVNRPKKDQILVLRDRFQSHRHDARTWRRKASEALSNSCAEQQ